MENQPISERLDPNPRLGSYWLWVEALLVTISGITFAALISSFLVGGREYPARYFVWSMAVLFLPYLVTDLLLKWSPLSTSSHGVALMLSAMGMVLTFPLVTIQALFWGMTAFWKDSTNLLALCAGISQTLLILLAGRMFLLQGGRMRNLLGRVLAGMILGLVLFGPLLFLVVLGAGM